MQRHFFKTAAFILVLTMIAGCHQPRARTDTAAQSVPPTTADNSSSPPPVSTPLPTLAPMLAKASHAVVNISVDSTQMAQANPFFQDPFFRRFFGVPDQQQQLKQHVRAVGSGFIYDAKNGYVVTNNHVIENADTIKVRLDDRREVSAKLVGTDPQTDIAVLKIDADNLSALPLGDSSKLRVGDYVVAIGNPFGVGQTATFGIVSATGRSNLGIEGYEDFIQTDASINPGNSGGPLLDLNGNLVGINTAILSESGGNVGIGFAIPISMAKGVITQLIKTGKVSRGRLGVLVQDLTPEIAEAMGGGAKDGALVSQVDPNSGADKAGIKPGDVITAVNGTEIHSASDLKNEIGALEPGATVTLTVWHKNNQTQVSAKLQPIEATTSTASTPQSSPIAGVTFGPIPENDPNYGKVKGVYVANVESGSKADAAGLQAGDIVLSVDQQEVSSPDQIGRIIDNNKNKPLLLNIKRGQAALFIAIQ